MSWCSDPRVGLERLYATCAAESGVALLETRSPISRRVADKVCAVAACRTVVAKVRRLNATADCRLTGESVLLVRDVLDPLAASPQCANASSGSWDDDDGGDTIVFPTSGPAYTYGGGDPSSGLTVLEIVAIVVAALALVAGAVVYVRKRRQRENTDHDDEALAYDPKKEDPGRDIHASPQSMDGTAPLTSPVRLPKPSAPTATRSSSSSPWKPTPSAPTASRTSMPTPSAPTASHTSNPQPSAPTASLTLWTDASSQQPRQVPVRSVETLLAEDQVLLARHMRADDIEDIRVIGSGGHGIVYLVRYRRTRLLASKRLVLDRVTTPKMLAFIDEIKLVAQLDHACIVPFVGAAWTNENDLQALFEYMPNGDLCTHLAKTSQSDPLRGWDVAKLQIALDVIHALVYVHSFAPPLVHRDLKSRNVLLDQNLRGKLSDFGVSRYQSDALTMTTGVGTSRWLAPEVINGGGEYNERCDVYSFGMVLVELDTHALPFAGLRSASRNAMPEMAMLQLVSEGKLQPTFRDSCPKSVLAIAHKCLAFNPTLRPSAMDVAYALRTIAETEFQYEPLH